MSIFKELYHLDVNKNTEKVDNLTYLSWAWAWAEVKKADPEATYEIHSFPMMTHDFQVIEEVRVPFLKTPEGYFVKTSVTIKGHTLSETLPVMNNKNVPLGTMAPQWVKPQGGGKAKQEYKQMPTPTAFDINKSHKRCLAKNIALHGLGLYIYAGEDIPEKDQEEEAKKAEEAKEIAKNIRELQRQTRKTKEEELANALDAYVQELQTKAKLKIENMPLDFIIKAEKLIKQKLDGLTFTKKEAQSPKEEAKA